MQIYLFSLSSKSDVEMYPKPDCAMEIDGDDQRILSKRGNGAAT